MFNWTALVGWSYLEAAAAIIQGRNDDSRTTVVVVRAVRRAQVLDVFRGGGQHSGTRPPSPAGMSLCSSSLGEELSGSPSGSWLVPGVAGAGQQQLPK